MIPVVFKKPAKFILPEGEVLAIAEIDLYKSKQYGIELTIPVRIGSYSKNHARGEVANINAQHLVSKELSEYYHQIKMLVFHCGWLGEVLFSRVKRINDSVKSDPAYEGVFNSFMEQKNKGREPKIPYEKLDFMGHKDLLSCVLKEMGKKETLPFNRKDFSTLFQDIIVQRNSFIHGELFMLDTQNGYQTVLESDQGYQILDKEILNSFSECYDELAEKLIWITKIIKPKEIN